MRTRFALKIHRLQPAYKIYRPRSTGSRDLPGIAVCCPFKVYIAWIREESCWRSIVEERFEEIDVLRMRLEHTVG